jgi:hypothetical protein
MLSACASADPGTTVDASVGGSPDARTQPNVDAYVPPSDVAQANTCVTAQTCQGAQMLGTVSGDSGAMTLSANGYQSAWYRVRVTEDFSEEIGLALRVAAKLQGTGFEAFVYVNAASDTIECSTTTGTVSQNGNMKETRAEWGEGFIPNGADDSRNVTIEIRPSGTSCSMNQGWQLDIEGNWL